MQVTEHGKSLMDRVVRHTPPSINRDIMEKTGKSLLFHAYRPGRISRRIEMLKREWDIERAIEANAASLGLSGLILALLFRSWWILLLPVVILGFLLQHAIQGWCPPVSIFRRLGMRTKEEIQFELYGLRMLKGDFDEAHEISRMNAGDRVERIMETLNRRI
ncbi:MAG TPA: hypothetical protein PLJ30_07950 [Deltaproteobacteria bacterium]|jgi:hypothetical protein|nr:DUF2892 domain-containing protein [Deltaproteobacteria bacterium]MDI9544145.1 hypothetical protein [Pseudomonadota bacterium]HNR51211.1 hypothetical protein [Deltaproteobacteria bacterium]HNU74731.1 hypothetical protein [Deltaproteobacteria bacterium]HOS25889.1 hypothetical protein [Deltaproteobacteria bacterium]